MNSSPTSASSSVEVTRVDGYLIFLFVLLSTATLFDGFEAAMLTVAAPDTRKTLGISLSEWGVIFGITRLGMLASFFFLLFADRWGRRTLMMLTIIGFAVFNSLTAFAVGKIDFTIYQFLARIFLTAEYALAIIMIGEEFPARLRGRATGYGWTTNLFGRVAEVGTPLVISAFISTLGISGAVAVTAVGPIIGALLVMRYAPETKGLTLEEVQRVMGSEAVPPDNRVASPVKSASGAE